MIKTINGNVYHISDSNKKLIPNENTNFLIWNLPAIKTCPFATEHCKKACYALKAEKQYKKDCPKARRENLEASKSDDFVNAMVSVILARVRGMRKRNLIVRIHESGDFYNKAYALKWLEIARKCEHIDGTNGKKVTFIAYTKSFPYFDGEILPSNFSLRASIWDDTKPEQIAIILKNNWPIYTAVESFTENDSFKQCRCSDCATCGKCWDSTIQDIRCEIH